MIFFQLEPIPISKDLACCRTTIVSETPTALSQSSDNEAEVVTFSDVEEFDEIDVDGFDEIEEV